MGCHNKELSITNPKEKIIFETKCTNVKGNAVKNIVNILTDLSSSIFL